MSFLSQPRTLKIKNTYINGFLDCSGDVVLRAGNVIIGNISQPGYNANQLSVLVNGRTVMNGNVIVNGNLFVSSNNIALGLRAGNITNGIQDGVPNGLNTTAVGSFSGMNHTGVNNTFIGSVAGQTSSTTYFSRTGSNNTYVGYRTSANNSAWGNSTAVGTGAVITASNQIVLGTAEEIVTTGGNVRITNQTNSTNTTSGALQVSGGIGTSGAIIAGGSIYAGFGSNRSVELGADAVNTAYIDFHSLDAFSNDYDSRIKSVGGTSGTSSRGALSLESESLTITGNTTISKTTASTTSTNGALVVTGGLGVGGNVNVGGFSAFTRDSSFSGNILLTQLNNPLWLVSRNASVVNSTLSSNGSDVGIFYGTTTPAAAGLVVSPRGAGGGIKMDIRGNVGINTASPRFTFDVAGIIGIENNINNKKLVLWDNAATDNPTTATNFYGFGVNNSMLRYQVDTVSASHAFYCGATENMRIVSSKVGINTASPGYALDVTGDIRSTTLVICRIGTTTGYCQLNTGSNLNPGYISFFKPDGGRAGYVGWQATANYLAMNVESGYVGYEVGGIMRAAGLVVTGANTLTWSSYGSRGIRAADQASATYGNISVTGAGLNGWVGYDINGRYTFMANGNEVGIHDNLYSWCVRFVNGDPYFGRTVNAPAFNATSDYRMKNNVQPILTNRSIDLLNPVEYDLSGCSHDMGFIAHEVQEIFPFLVKGEKDGKEMQSLNYNGFIALLVKEVQGLKKENREQHTQIEELVNTIKSQQSQIDMLIHHFTFQMPTPPRPSGSSGRHI